MAKGFGVSPVTNRIYYGTQNPEKHMWTALKKKPKPTVISGLNSMHQMKYWKCKYGKGL